MNWILPAMVFLPFAAAIPSYALGRKKSGGSLLLLSASSIAVFALALALFLTAGDSSRFSIPGIVGLGISFNGDGFRSL